MKEMKIRVKGGGARGILLWAGIAAATVILVLAVLKGVLGISLAFFKTTLSLKPTTLQLEDIQDLEFLVTAEYFGEVIGTARDYFTRRTLPRAEGLCVRLIRTSDPASEKFSAEEQEILNVIRAALIQRSGPSPAVMGRINDWKRVADMLRLEMRNDRFSPAFAELLLKQLLAKRDIAYLARGSVQAGYDLKNLSADAYFYCPSTRTLFLGSRVQVFGRQINPWFIYDPASEVFVKGFEIISQNNIDLEDEGVFDFLKAIKDECQSRLGDDAVREGIETQARESAERTLENMLKMLKSDVQTVRILSVEEFERQKSVCPDSGRAVLSGR